MRFVVGFSFILLSGTLLADTEGIDSAIEAKRYWSEQEETRALPDEVVRLLRKYKIPHKDLSVKVINLNAQTPILSHNAEVLRTPASIMKIVTTYAGLKLLGANYQWQSEAYIRGSLVDGVLNGDLLLKGYGDPFLVEEHFWRLLQGIKRKGIRRIEGDLIIDNGYFNLPGYDPAAFDDKPLRVYNAVPSALMYNFQASRFLLSAD